MIFKKSHLTKGGNTMPENRCGCGCGFGFDNDCIWIIVLILILCCCCGGNSGRGCC